MESVVWSENIADDPDRDGLIMVDHEVRVVKRGGEVRLIYETTPGFGWTEDEGDLPSGPGTLEEAIRLLEGWREHCKERYYEAKRVLNRARKATSFENAGLRPG